MVDAISKLQEAIQSERPVEVPSAEAATIAAIDAAVVEAEAEAVAREGTMQLAASSIASGTGQDASLPIKGQRGNLCLVLAVSQAVPEEQPSEMPTLQREAAVEEPSDKHTNLQPGRQPSQGLSSLCLANLILTAPVQRNSIRIHQRGRFSCLAVIKTEEQWSILSLILDGQHDHLQTFLGSL